MKYVGIDLHKKTIVVCVVNKERKVLERKKFLCVDVQTITTWFGQLGPFQFVVEATADPHKALWPSLVDVGHSRQSAHPRTHLPESESGDPPTR